MHFRYQFARMKYRQYIFLNTTCIIILKIDIPSVSIVGNLQVTVGNAVTIKGIIQSCPTRVSAIWQKNGKLDMEDFENLDIDDSKYLGSKNDPEHPILVIPKTTHEDEIYYRLVVSNGMGQGSSNAICLELIGGKCKFLFGMIPFLLHNL